jgi:3-hydroxyacyl-CoA dehydrogenase
VPAPGRLCAPDGPHAGAGGDTPGFIVNHAGRGYGTEALRIVGEGVADFATIDRILRDQVGFAWARSSCST